MADPVTVVLVATALKTMAIACYEGVQDVKQVPDALASLMHTTDTALVLLDHMKRRNLELLKGDKSEVEGLLTTVQKFTHKLQTKHNLLGRSSNKTKEFFEAFCGVDDNLSTIHKLQSALKELIDKAIRPALFEFKDVVQVDTLIDDASKSFWIEKFSPNQEQIDVQTLVSHLISFFIAETGNDYQKQRELLTRTPMIFSHVVSESLELWNGATIVRLDDFHARIRGPGVLHWISQRLESYEKTFLKLLEGPLRGDFRFSANLNSDQHGRKDEVSLGQIFVSLPLQEIEKEDGKTRKVNEKKRFLEHFLSITNLDIEKSSSQIRTHLLLGSSGQGKTTSCTYLCQVLRSHILLDFCEVGEFTRSIEEFFSKQKQLLHTDNHQHRTPVHISLPLFATSEKSVIDFIASQFEASDKELKSHVRTDNEFSILVREAFSYLPWLIVFDGLDEVPSSLVEKNLLSIVAFLQDHFFHDLIVIFTSRPREVPIGFSTTIKNITKSKLLELSQEDIREIAYNQLSKDEIKNDASVQTRLNNLFQILEQTNNLKTPFQVSLLLKLQSTSKNQTAIERWRLYEEYMNQTLARELDKNRGKNPLSEVHVNNLLQAIALYLHFTENTVTKRDVVRTFIQDYFGDSLEDTPNLIKEYENFLFGLSFMSSHYDHNLLQLGHVDLHNLVVSKALEQSTNLESLLASLNESFLFLHSWHGPVLMLLQRKLTQANEFAKLLVGLNAKQSDSSAPFILRGSCWAVQLYVLQKWEQGKEFTNKQKAWLFVIAKKILETSEEEDRFYRGYKLALLKLQKEAGISRDDFLNLALRNKEQVADKFLELINSLEKRLSPEELDHLGKEDHQSVVDSLREGQIEMIKALEASPSGSTWKKQKADNLPSLFSKFTLLKSFIDPLVDQDFDV